MMCAMSGPRILSADRNGATFDQIPTPREASVDVQSKKDDKMLAIVFCLMVVIGLGNKVRLEKYPFIILA